MTLKPICRCCAGYLEREVHRDVLSCRLCGHEVTGMMLEAMYWRWRKGWRRRWWKLRLGLFGV